MMGFAVEQIPGEGVAVRSVGVLSRYWFGRETQTRNRGGVQRDSAPTAREYLMLKIYTELRRIIDTFVLQH